MYFILRFVVMSILFLDTELIQISPAFFNVVPVLVKVGAIQSPTTSTTTLFNSFKFLLASFNLSERVCKYLNSSLQELASLL